MVGLTAPSWLKVNLINKQKMATVITQFITQKTQTNQQAIQFPEGLYPITFQS
jgi:hypothetical protein